MMTQRVDPEHDVLGFTVDWITALAEHVERLTVLTAYEGSHDLPENVSVRSYGKERGFAKPRRVMEFQRHCLALRREGIDSVFAHMIPQYVLASWPVLGRSCRYVMWYAHGTIGWDTRIAHRLIDVVVTATPQSFRLPSEKVFTVGHGIDMERFTPGTVDSVRGRLLNVGRIAPVKNTHRLVEAVGILRDRGRPVELRLVGGLSRADRAYLTEVRTTIDDLGLGDRIELVESVPHDQIVDEYRRSGLFISASQTGSLDKVEVESMACGTPPICCNDAFLELVTESSLESDQLTFPPGDVATLADRVEGVLDLAEREYHGIATNCREVVATNHSVDALMETVAGHLRGSVCV